MNECMSHGSVNEPHLGAITGSRMKQEGPGPSFASYANLDKLLF